MYLLGVLEDNLGLFGKAYNYFLGYPSGWVDAATTQPLFKSFEWFFIVLNPVTAYNLLVIASCVLCVWSAFYFFRHFFSNFVALLLAIQVLFSGFFMYHMRSHLDLLQVWVVFIFLSLLIRKLSFKNSILVGLSLFLASGLSNYLGFICLLLLGLYVCTNCSWQRFLHGVLSFGVFIIFMLPFVYKYTQVIYERESFYTQQVHYVTRGIADFVMFSSRPWFFVVPSVDNIFYGTLAQKFYTKLFTWNYWLADDYFKSEHSTLFLGITNLVIASIVAFQKRNRSWILMIFGLMLLTLPPYFTVNLHKIYTPGYAVWYFFPMFRVTARLGLAIFILLLLLVGQTYEIILGKRYGFVVVASLFLLSISEFVIPIKLTYVGEQPDIYKYLTVVSEPTDWVAIYPTEKTDDIFLWIKDVKRPIINPANQTVAGVSSNEFTEQLSTCEGQQSLQLLNAKYLVRFVDDSDFIESAALSKLATFGQDAILYKVSNNPIISCPQLK